MGVSSYLLCAKYSAKMRIKMDKILEKWDEILSTVKHEHDISDISFDTWIRPLEVYGVEGSTLYILVPSEQMTLSYISKKYYLPLKVTIAELTGTEYEIKFILPEQTKNIRTGNSGVPKKNALSEKADRSNLNPNYTFDTFVVGSNNRFAQSASLAVAESPGEAYNPLYIYGGPGLGKTHLMHSIGHFILERNPNAKVLYVTSEEFTNEVIESIRSGNASAMNKLREKYRTIDVLMVDDVQFIIGKESTQEEFFHTFNHLHNAGKQIVISSDKPPKDMTTLEARLRTRFEWGLIADISVPDYETRMAILYKKIELDQLERYQIPDEVIQYIAMNIKTNIRELEGSLNKLIALYRIGGRKNFDVSLAADALKDMIAPDDSHKVTPELVLDVVSDHFNVSVSELKGSRRNARTAGARQIVMYLCRQMTDASLQSIGDLLGGRDHSTVNHGVDKIARDVEKDETLRNTIEIIQKKISPL